MVWVLKCIAQDDGIGALPERLCRRLMLASTQDNAHAQVHGPKRAYSALGCSGRKITARAALRVARGEMLTLARRAWRSASVSPGRYRLRRWCRGPGANDTLSLKNACFGVIGVAWQGGHGNFTVKILMLSKVNSRELPCDIRRCGDLRF